MTGVKIASTQTEIDAILLLRYKVLREPWQQPFETASDGLEADAINAYLKDDNGLVIACGRLQKNSNTSGQIRFMAVDPNYRSRGFGKSILLALEKKARELSLKEIELQARENAVDFYKRNNYSIKEKSFLLWGIIQHYLMGKHLD